MEDASLLKHSSFFDSIKGGVLGCGGGQQCRSWWMIGPLRARTAPKRVSWIYMLPHQLIGCPGGGGWGPFLKTLESSLSYSSSSFFSPGTFRGAVLS
jgi:hypothetical protein